jgi:hypothetical protein
MSRAGIFVEGMSHVDFMRLLSIFSARKEVAHLMTYGIEGIEEDEKASIREVLGTFRFSAQNDFEIEDFCRSIHERAVKEKG